MIDEQSDAITANNQDGGCVREGVFYIDKDEVDGDNKKQMHTRKTRKNVNTANHHFDKQTQMGLFDERQVPQKRSFFGRVLNAFNTSSFTIYEDKDGFINDNEEGDDFFSTPAIIRNKKLAG